MIARWAVIAGMVLLFAARSQMFAPSGMRTAPPGAPTSRTFASPKGEVRLVLEETTGANAFDPMTRKVIASMAKRSGGSWQALWNTAFTSGQVQFLRESDVFVSEEGEFFLLATRNGSDVVLHRKEKSFPLEPGRSRAGPVFLSFSEKLIGFDTLEGKQIVRIWDRDRNSWFAYETGGGSPVTVDSATANRWSETMRQEILEKLMAARHEHLRRRLNKASGALGRIANVAFRTNAVPEVSEIYYEFLTGLRRPEDRRWIEELLDIGDEEGRWGAWSFVDEPDYYTASATDFVRARADWLLGVWDDKAKREMAPRRMWGREGELPKFALGKVTGTVRFATAINLTFRYKAAAFRLHLVRASDAGAPDAEAEAEINHALPNLPKNDEELTDELSFAFNTVRPGEYKLKAIWDKRPPFANTNSAGPGDYESAWSGPFKVAAGGVVSNLVLHCTNRVAGGESYYAVDESMRRHWKETGEYARFTFATDKDGGQDTFSRNAKFWVVRTNVAAASNVATIARIGLRSWKRSRPRQIQRPDVLVVQFNKRGQEGGKALLAPREVKLLDEHGCAFRQSYFTESKESVTFSFLSFPRAGATWHIVGYAPVFNAKPAEAPVALDYTITNLVRGPVNTEVAGAALPAVIDLGRVKMNVSAVRQNGFDLQVDTTFMENGTPSFTWAVQEAWGVDRHGNVIRPGDVCREEKAVRVVGHIESFSGEKVTLPFEIGLLRTAFQMD